MGSPRLPSSWRLAVLLLPLLLAACVAERGGGGGDGDGGACDRSSDCDDPTQRCVDGRCANECGDDRDCPSELFCVAGTCAADGQPCRADRDCRYNQACTQGLCETIEGYCEQNRDCPNGSLCDGDQRRCIAEPGRCFDAGDCVADEVCVDGTCTPASAMECVDDAGCDPGEICLRGACADECVEDRDCDPQERCAQGRCEVASSNNVNNNPNNNPNNSNNNPNNINNNPNNSNPGGARGCEREPALCLAREECCEDLCVDRGLCVPANNANNNTGQDDYWDTCTSAQECASELCLGDPQGTGRCVVRCSGRRDCPQAPVSSFCIQGYHLVTHQAGGNALIGLCYQDDTGAACDPQRPNPCLDGLCIHRAPRGVVEGQCTLRCETAADCAAGMACGPKEFNVNGAAELINVCVPIGETCAGVGAEAADQCYSSFCVTDDNDVGRCTTLCATGAECPPGWTCQDAGGTGICWQ